MSPVEIWLLVIVAGLRIVAFLFLLTGFEFADDWPFGQCAVGRLGGVGDGYYGDTLGSLTAAVDGGDGFV